MVPVALYDTLLISPTEPADSKADIQLTIDSGEFRSACNEENLPSAENTVVQAIKALRSQLRGQGTTNQGALARDSQGIRVRLIKRIPVAAGLAGGSSDAAAALRGAAALWDAQVDDAELSAAAARVGSDVPFFLPGGAAICRGRGEETSPCALPRMHFVIVKPPDGLSTAKVYQACAASAPQFAVESLVEALRQGDWRRIRKALFNGLEHAAEQLCPAISELRAAFEQQNVIAHQMSGSGTSYFGICASARSARSVAARLRARNLGRVFAVSSCA